MANYFTHFSCLFDVGAPENLKPALAIYERHAEALDADDGIDIGFRAEADPHAGPSMLWLSSDEAGDPEHVIAFVLACAEAFDLSGRWGFVWALTCSKPRLDGFGGGAQLIDLGQRRSLAWLDCEHCLAAALDPAFDVDTGVAQSALPGGEPAMGRGEPVGNDGEAGSAAPSLPAT